MFARLGRWCYQRRFVVVGLWLAVAVTTGTILGLVGTRTATEFTLPDVESRQGVDIFEEHFNGQGAGMTAPVVFVAEQGVDDPEVRAAMEELFAFVDEMDGTSVVSPYTEAGERQVATEGDMAGRLAYASVEMASGTSYEDAQEIAPEIREAIPTISGLEVAVGSEMFAEFEEPTAELVGIAFAIVILIVAFGSVIAMGLPIGVGLAGIGVGWIAAGFLTHVFEVPDFATTVGIMIGLGVGIDYALFIVTRFRENRRSGQGVEQSIVTAINTAGRAVAFAGATVVVSLLGMLIMQLGFITGMAVTASTIVAVTMAASLTLLPALMGIIGDRVEVTRLRGVIAAGLMSLTLLGVAFTVDPLLFAMPLALVVLMVGFAYYPLTREQAPERGSFWQSVVFRWDKVVRKLPAAPGRINTLLPPRQERPVEQTAAYRWSRVIQHHPWPTALLGAAVLIVLALPVLSMRLGFSDEGNYPTSTDTRQAYDLLADGFGPGYNGPLLLATELPSGGADPAVLATITDTLNSDDGVADASPPVLNDPDAPTAAMWTVVPETSPQDEETSDLVKHLRSETLPALTSGTGLDIAIAGNVAMNVDFTDYLGERLVFFFAAVLAVSFVLLMIVFRSILVPLKAVIMNLLGIGAAYGVIIAGFQWGWLGPVLGVDSGPIEPFMPMMLFAIVFGLSMDYEVFLLSRIKEDYDRSGDSHTSVANGLAATARVITAAALIMISVFGAFSLGDERVIKMAGIGLGFAVLLDATLIRMLLVPATMELLGDRNWWLPRWLDRLLPTIDVEGHGAAQDSESQDETEGDSDRELQPA